MELTPSLVALGITNGLIYGTLAVGVVLVRRVSGVVHLGQAAVGVPSAGALAVAVERWGVPWWLALAPSLLVAGAAAVALHAAVDLRLRDTPPVVRLIATLGGGQALLLAGIALLDRAQTGRRVPGPPGIPALELPALRIDPAQVLGLVALPITVALVGVFLARSRSGLAVRAVAADAELALTAGIDSAAAGRLVWCLAGALSGLTAVVVLPSGQVGVSSGLTMLARVLVVVVLARSGGLAVVVGVGLLLGVVEQTVLDASTRSDPTTWLLWGITVVALAAPRHRAARRTSGRVSSPWGRLRTTRRAHLEVRGAPVALVVTGLALIGALVLPAPAALALALAAAYAVMAMGAGIETALVGGLPLGVAAVAGAAGAVSVVAVNATGVFVAGPALAMAAGAVFAVLAAWPARGADLLGAATASLAAGLVLERTVVPQLVGDGQVPGRPVVGGFAVVGSAAYAVGAIGLAVAVSALVALVWRGRLGRRLVLLRDDPQVARSLGLAERRVRLAGLALGGAVTGLGGALYAHALPVFTPASLSLDAGVLLLAMLAVGGIASPYGGVLGAALVAAVPLLVGGNVGDLAAVALGWLLLLLYLPGGVASLVSTRNSRSAAATAPPPAARHRPRDAAPHEDALLEPQRGVVLEAERVTLRHESVRVLDEVSVRLHPGEVVGLVGPNGAGKSSLLDVLSGRTPPCAGRVRTQPGLRRGQLVRCFQDGLLPSTLSGQDLLAIAHGGMRERSRAAATLADAGLTHLADVPLRAMSHGQRRRIELAAAAGRSPRVLLLDEPTARVARDDLEHVLDLISRARAGGCAVLVATHDDDVITGLCDRVLRLRGGRLSEQGTTARNA